VSGCVQGFRRASIAQRAIRMVAGTMLILGVWFSMANLEEGFGPQGFVGFMVEYRIGEMTKNRRRQQLEKQDKRMTSVDMRVGVQLMGDLS
jgi:hypothetical protein